MCPSDDGAVREADLTGAWRRRRLTVCGAVLQRRTVCTWLQAGRWFVDVRTGGAAAAFAGTSVWDAPSMRWLHLVDSARGRPVDDRARLRWDGATLVERGRLSGVPFVERWSRLDGDRRPLDVRVFPAPGHPAGVYVRVGTWAAAVLRLDPGSAAAVWQRSNRHGWLLQQAFGAVELLAHPAVEPGRAEGAGRWVAVAPEATARGAATPAHPPRE